MATSTKSEPGAAREKLFAIIHDLEVGMLTTVRANASLHTRPMVTRFDEPSTDLWFFITGDAPKTREIEHDQEVSVAYADPKRQLYATVAGRATRVVDRAMMARLWIPSLIVWFPHGLDDPALALLRVKIRSGEYWDAPSRSMVELIAAVQDALDHPPPVDTGDHAKVRIE